MTITKINFMLMLVSFLLTIVIAIIAELISRRALSTYNKTGELSEISLIWVTRLVGWMDESTKIVAFTLLMIIPALIIDWIIR